MSQYIVYIYIKIIYKTRKLGRTELTNMIQDIRDKAKVKGWIL